jgi:hypothetical protein
MGGTEWRSTSPRPPWGGCFPRMEVPERRVTGPDRRMARCPAVGNAVPSPTSSRIRAAVLTPTPGTEVRTRARGCASSILSTWSAICRRWVRTWAGASARRGSTVWAGVEQRRSEADAAAEEVQRGTGGHPGSAHAAPITERAARGTCRPPPWRSLTTAGSRTCNSRPRGPPRRSEFIDNHSPREARRRRCGSRLTSDPTDTGDAGSGLMSDRSSAIRATPARRRAHRWRVDDSRDSPGGPTGVPRTGRGRAR